MRSIELIAEAAALAQVRFARSGARTSGAGAIGDETQKWFMFRFVGAEKEIDVRRPAGGAYDAEFDDWRWERFDRLPDLVVPFKRQVYEAVAAAFAPLARAPRQALAGSLIRPLRTTFPPARKAGKFER